MTRQLAPAEIEVIARATHEVNRAYCLLLGDATHLPWDTAPEWQKSSARSGVIGVAVNNYTPEQSHDSWSQHKLAEGWKYGPVKDPEKKEHPCLVPYAQLPEEQRIKDHLFTTTVKSFLDAIWRIPQ